MAYEDGTRNEKERRAGMEGEAPPGPVLWLAPCLLVGRRLRRLFGDGSPGGPPAQENESEYEQEQEQEQEKGRGQEKARHGVQPRDRCSLLCLRVLNLGPCPSCRTRP